MTDDFRSQPSITFWIIGGAALIWNLFGMIIYVGQVTATPEALAEGGYTPEQIAFVEATPAWVTSAFALAVTTGVLGSILLLLRKALALPVFVLSLVAILAQNVYSHVLNDAVAVFGSGVLVIPTTVIVIAVALVWYSRSVKAKGWIS
ncbi:MAG: hypothetical protein R3176_03510 [Woeseiaceae bacterium]|nr:hypothetical protein [Woeseiaceae bacterium]